MLLPRSLALCNISPTERKMELSLSRATPILVLVLLSSLASCFGANVTYDRRSLIIDGQRKLFISASIHYPRTVPGMWPGLVQMAKDGGANTIESYVFWIGHEPSQGNYYFGDRYDLVKFEKIIQNSGMYMILQIGPFIGPEWSYGEVPIWLHYVPGTVFRTNNEPFKYHMQKFVTFIVNLMKKEELFASQGGPIILAQVENEYGFYEQHYGEGAKPYVMWAANMAVSQNTGVPWIMFQQPDAPEYIIYTCHGFYCDQYAPMLQISPKFENWPAWMADVYTSSGFCVAFLANIDDKEDKTVQFRNMSYHLPAWTVSILPDCKNVVFHSAKVRAQSAVVDMVPESLIPSASSLDKDPKAFKWEIFGEKPGLWGKEDFSLNGFVDHLNTTKYTTEYLWYRTSL